MSEWAGRRKVGVQIATRFVEDLCPYSQNENVSGNFDIAATPAILFFFGVFLHALSKLRADGPAYKLRDNFHKLWSGGGDVCTVRK